MSASELQATSALLTVREAAELLAVSESWVRRHLAELPVTRAGRLIRINSALLSEKFQGTMPGGNSLKPERTPMFNRYQRGCVIARGKKGKKVWYGKFREDVLTPAGIERRQRFVRLGTLGELATKNAARNKLAEVLGDSAPPTVMDITFGELAERWEKAEGSTMKPTTLSHYRNALRAYVLPTFGQRKIATINREDIQSLLAEKAHNYSQSTLRSMRVVLGLTLGWAADCGWLEKNPCTRVKLPKRAGGRKVIRTILTAEQINAIAGKLKEPYATLVLFLAATGLRIGEALAIKWTDFRNNVLHVTRRIYDGDLDAVKSKRSDRKLPIDLSLVVRMEKLGKGEWVFRSRTGTPLNAGNALKRYVRPAAEELGISLGGWHDFRHTLSTTLRRSGIHPKVVSDILGHQKVNLAMDVYDRTDVQDLAQPLSQVAKELVSNGIKSGAAA